MQRRTVMNGNNSCIRLVAFDLDGTLIHGDTVCEAIAHRLGHLSRMRELEHLTELEDIKAAREEMAKWYASSTLSELCSYLTSTRLAQGVEEGFSLLKQHDVKIAIVSITWEFAVEWFAKRLDADYYVGTQLSPEGRIAHFWPKDKPRWLRRAMDELGLTRGEAAAVGNSKDDVDMLRAVDHPFFVGRAKPEGLSSLPHYPDGNMLHVAEAIVRIGRRFG